MEKYKLPTYTKGEEIFNMITHIVGAAFAIAALVLCVVFAARHHNVYGVISGAIYGSTMIILYVMSSIYHGLSPNVGAKRVFRIIDHCTIFLFIAGSYMPFALCTYRECNTTLGWSIFGVSLGFSILGVILNIIDIEKFKIFSMVCYLALGWCGIFTIPMLYSGIGIPGIALLASGGVVYSIGAVFYKLGKTKKYMHSIFHILIVIASVLQFLCILLYVM